MTKQRPDPARFRAGIFPLGQTNSLRAQYIEIFPANANASAVNAPWELGRPLRRRSTSSLWQRRIVKAIVERDAHFPP